MNKCRKLLFLPIGWVFLLIISSDGFAVPAAPLTQTLSQPDGTTFKARKWGDENVNGWETVEGYTIVFDEKLDRWTYADHGPDGSLVSSGMIVGRRMASSMLEKKLRPKGKAMPGAVFKRLSKELKGRRKAEGVSSPEELSSPISEAAVPPGGIGYVPTILINFNDRTATYTTADFDALLFGTGNSSMKDYYEEISYGAFSVSAGPGGVVGWYTASNTHDYYGSNDSTGNDSYPGTLVREAVAAADAAGFDFAPYDQDGDCYVDVVAIVHQGSGEEAGVATDIWSSRWNLNSAYYYGYSNGGEYTTNSNCTSNPSAKVKVNDYIIQPEILLGNRQTMGVFAHEYGHSLGLPDLYDTDNSSEGIGNWSLMAGGSWNFVSRPGDRPAHMDAWSKYFLGWVTPTEVSGTLIDQPITGAATAPDVYKLLPGDPLSGEYFLVENRQKSGFDAGLPGAGLLIWHIDGNKISNAMNSNTVNNYECYPGGPSCATDHYGVKLMQADNLWDMEKGINRGDGGDPFPGSANKKIFNGGSSPNSILYSGVLSSVSVADISAPGPVMTATLSILPDLVISSLYIPPTVSFPGANISITDITRNRLASAAGASRTAFYLSTDCTLDGGDILLGDRAVPALGGYGSSAATTSVTIPAAATLGTYFIIARADNGDAVPESNETNNTRCSNAITVSGADLVILSVYAPVSAKRGNTITIADVTKNRLAGTAGASATGVYLSATTAGGTLIGSRPVPALAGGAQSTATYAVTIPAATAPGVYYIIWKADYLGVSGETDSTNNTKYKSITITK